MTPCYGHNTCCNRDEFSRTIFPCSVEQRIAAANQNRRVSVTPQERAEAAFDYFRDHGWIEDMHSKSVCVGMELAIAAAITEAVAAEREECIADVEGAMAHAGTDDPHEALDMAVAAIRARAVRESGVQEDKP
jgi:hypothetical protein